MALKIRLRQQGRTNRTFYRFVVTDVRCRRDGKYVEALGWYNPIESELEKSLFIKPDRVEHWMSVGAQLTENAKTLLMKVAPEIVTRQTEKLLAGKAKKAQKRRARRKATAA